MRYDRCVTSIVNDEFGLFHENAEEAGLPWHGAPAVRREDVDGVSALVWGEPGTAGELVLLHGGAQNAHTWDTVALALGLPLVAIDLPGHGRSAWRDDHDYRPAAVAPAVAAAVAELAPDAKAVVGMSMGGLTSLALADLRPDLVPRLCLVDVTPGVNRDKAAAIIAFVAGPEVFDSFDAILERTVEHNPTRSLSSLRRGVLHNAAEQPDGTWTWRYDRLRLVGEEGGPDRIAELGELWDVVSELQSPLLLVRGALSPVVGDEDVAELQRRKPDAEVVVVDGAGHSVQGDQPVALARLLADFIRWP